jgi:branched-chain amino acid transport system substrate-binding protein
MTASGPRNGLRAASVVSFLAAMMLLISACSSSGKSSGKSAVGAGSGSAHSSSATCSGTPVEIETIATLSGGVSLHPEVVDATQAAAANLNASCALGRPIHVTPCDDKFNPNSASDCAREAVSHKVLAVVGDDQFFTDQTLPILAAAGIPDVGNFQNSQGASTSPSSFPLESSLTNTIGYIATAVSTGATNIALVSVSTPSVQFSVNLAKQALSSFGAKLVTNVLVSPTQTDFTAAAAQVQDSGATAVMSLLTQNGTLQMINALRGQGTDFDKVAFVSTTLTDTPVVLEQWGPKVTEGIYLVGGAWPVTDTTNPGIKQMTAELQAAGKDPARQSDLGVGAWAGLHLLGTLLHGQSVDTATLVSKLKTAKVNVPELPPVDFSKSAYPNNPGLKGLRIYSNQVVVSRMEGGKIVPVSGGYVSTDKKFTITK